MPLPSPLHLTRQLLGSSHQHCWVQEPCAAQLCVSTPSCPTVIRDSCYALVIPNICSLLAFSAVQKPNSYVEGNLAHCGREWWFPRKCLIVCLNWFYTGNKQPQKHFNIGFYWLFLCFGLQVYFLTSLPEPNLKFFQLLMWGLMENLEIWESTGKV